MTTATHHHEAFTGIFGALRAVYEAEIGRLTEAYRARILAGEFSGTADAGRGDPAYIRLENELEKAHPWAQSAELGRAVLAVSGWAHSDHATFENGLEAGLNLDDGLGAEVAECLAHDVLALAVRRGWVKGYKPNAPAYLLKVA